MVKTWWRRCAAMWPLVSRVILLIPTRTAAISWFARLLSCNRGCVLRAFNLGKRLTCPTQLSRHERRITKVQADDG